MTQYNSKSAAERSQIRNSNASYQQLSKMSATIAEDLAQLLCSGAIGGNMSGSDVIEMVSAQAGIEITRQDLQEIVCGTTLYDNSSLVKNIEL